ncbi:MAG: PilW family protein [Betaproteobacteria bacterium]
MNERRQNICRTTRGASALRSSGGFSLVELMVAVAVGLIGMLAIMQAFDSNERIKRSTTGVGMSQANGAIALYTLERDIRMGGYGFVQKDALNCSGFASLQWYYGGTYSSTTLPSPGGARAPIVLAPIVIQDGGAAAPDTITVTYGTDEKVLIPTVVGNSPPAGQMSVAANYGFDTNDLMLVAQPGACMLYNVTAPVAGDAATIIRIATGATGPFNPPSATAYSPVIANTSAVMNLGQLVVNKYDVSVSDFRVTPMFTNIGVAGQLPVYSNLPQVIGNDIVDLRAYYGKDTSQTFTSPPPVVAGAALTLTWDKIAPTTADGWSQVRVIKVALLARSGNYEKPNATTGLCDTTKLGDISLTFNNPMVSTAAGNAAFTIIPDGLPSCYRYRAFETTIPIRNLIWRS